MDTIYFAKLLFDSNNVREKGITDLRIKCETEIEDGRYKEINNNVVIVGDDGLNI